MKRLLLTLLVTLALALSACGQKASPENGQHLAALHGCSSCHSPDGSKKIGPTWQGLYGSTVTLTDGSTVTADEAYLAESIKDPSARIVDGYTPGAMPTFKLTDAEIADLVAYIKSLQ